MMLLTKLILTAFVGALFYVYYWLRRQQSQWPQLGIPSASRPHLFFGNVRGLGRTEHSAYILQRLYWEFKRQGLKLGGFMNFFQPAILIIDPEVVKSVLVTDFKVFHDRGFYVDTVGDPLSGGLFSLEGDQWRVMRQKLTPTFTSGKMRNMYGNVMSLAQEMKQFLLKNFYREDLVIKDVLQRFTMDVIGNVAFGIRCHVINNPDTDFTRMGRKAFDVDTFRLMKFFVGAQYKKLSRKFGLKVVPKDVTRFFLQLTEKIVRLRKNENAARNDFISLLLQIKNSDGDKLTIDEIAAQCYTYFTAGFETSSTTMNFCLYELAINPKIQEHLRREISEASIKDGGTLTYETLLAMDLLQRVVDETLRKYPPLDNLFRVTTRQYSFRDTAYTIPADTFVQIPVYAMHYDDEYFPEPYRFDPDRFLPDAARQRRAYTYLPFGEGARNCVGLRFGQMLTKIGLVALLSSFHFEPTGRTPRTMEFNPKVFTLAPETDVYLRVNPL